MEAADVIRAGQAHCKALSGKIRALPRRLVQLGLIPSETEAEVVAVCREILEDAASWRSLDDLVAAAADETSAA